MTDETQKLRDCQASMGRLVQALEWEWEAIRSHHPEVPDNVVIMPAPSGRRQKLGYFCANKWEAIDTPRSSELETFEDLLKPARHEVMIGAEGLDRHGNDVFETLLHEAAHGLAYARNIRDTSRNGHYHNMRFKQVAEELGLNVEYDERSGHALTTIPITTVAEYAAVLGDLTTALQIWRRPAQKLPKSDKNLLAGECGCERRIRAAKSEFKKGGITCNFCGEEFRPDDELNWEE